MRKERGEGIPRLRKEPPPVVPHLRRISGRSQETSLRARALSAKERMYLAQPTLCATILPLGVVLGSVTSARPIRNSDDCDLNYQGTCPRAKSVSNTSAATGAIWARGMLRLGIGVTLSRLLEARFPSKTRRTIGNYKPFSVDQAKASLANNDDVYESTVMGCSRKDEDHVEDWIHSDTTYRKPWLDSAGGNHPHTGTERDCVVPEILDNSPFRGSQAHAPR